jgi:hypothetical protein
VCFQDTLQGTIFLSAWSKRFPEGNKKLFHKLISARKLCVSASGPQPYAGESIDNSAFPPKHKMIARFWWQVLTTGPPPHKFPKKKLGRVFYFYLFFMVHELTFKGEDCMMNYSETCLDWTPLCSVQSVQSKKVFILRVTLKIGVLLGFVKELIDCHNLGRLQSMFYKMLAHLWQ